MAVAAHVGRVAKEYAPYGYSIMESASATITTAPSGTGSSIATIVLTDDADIYIESINIVGITANSADDTNFLTISVLSMKSGGTDSETHSTQTTKATGGAALVANTLFKQTVSKPVVAQSKLIQLKVDKATAHGNTNSITVGISVRYRRKA